MEKQDRKDDEDNFKNKLHVEHDELLAKKENFDEKDEFEKRFKDMPLTDDTTCGFGVFKGAFLQKYGRKFLFILFKI